MALVAPVDGHRIDSEVYAVSLKRGDECRLAFGRQIHDAQAGTIAFLAPGQTMTPLVPMVAPMVGELAWTLIFHPDLLAQAPPTFSGLSFFRYNSEEALHLTPAEQETLTGLIRRLDAEASRPPDAFANEVIHAHLSLFFAYCKRFYARQFQTRAQQSEGHVLARLQRHLDAYFNSSRPRTEGLPTVGSCARALGYSTDYLSDLLREETGHGAREHLHRELIALAKRRLSAPEHASATSRTVSASSTRSTSRSCSNSEPAVHRVTTSSRRLRQALCRELESLDDAAAALCSGVRQ